MIGWLMNEMEWICTEVGSDLIQDTMPAFAWRDWVKQLKTYVRKAGIRAKIWTLDFPNTKQKC
jgi:hypothetical protein